MRLSGAAGPEVISLWSLVSKPYGRAAISMPVSSGTEFKIKPGEIDKILKTKVHVEKLIIANRSFMDHPEGIVRDNFLNVFPFLNHLTISCINSQAAISGETLTQVNILASVVPSLIGWRLVNLRTLRIISSHIYSGLLGIQNFKKLKTLFLEDFSVTDLLPLEGSGITDLRIRRCQEFTELSLPGSLEKLTVDRCPGLGDVNISKCPNLASLSWNQCPSISFTGYTGLKDLKNLDISNHDFKHGFKLFVPIAHMPNLQTVSFTKCVLIYPIDWLLTLKEIRIAVFNKCGSVYSEDPERLLKLPIVSLAGGTRILRQDT
jgi:hypothetical protein